MQFVRHAAGQARPSFLYLAFNAPHHPMHAPERYKARFPHLPPDRRIMASMVSAMDDQIGALLDELERQGVRENTLVFFMSDNGPSRQSRNWLDGRLDPYYGGSAGKMKGHKFSLFEGGIRVPALMSWPGRVPAGQVVDGVAAGMDIFPAVLRAAGGDPAAYVLDGLDLAPMLCDRAASPHGSVFWEMGVQRAVRRGRWKLVLDGLLIEEEPQMDPVFLADMEADMAESRILASENPDLVAELRGELEAWLGDVEARWARDHAPRFASGENSFFVTDSSAMRVYDNPNNPAIGDT